MNIANIYRDLRIDFLKGIAMIMIVLLHSIQMIDGLSELIRKPILLGQIGVQLFFLCSGYLVVKPYSANGKTLDLHTSIRFFLKKYISLFVPFVTFLVIYLIVNYVYVTLQIELPYKNNTSILAILLNSLLLHGFFPFCLNNVVPGGWYVGTFLILIAISPLIMKWLKNGKQLLIAAVATALTSVVISIALNRIFHCDTSNGSFFYFSFLNQLPAYLIGMSLAFEAHEIKDSYFNHVLMDVVIGLAIVALFYFELSFSYALIPILAALMFADVFKLLTAVPNLIRSTKWICMIGRNTYVIYLSHFLAAWYIPVLIEKYFHIKGSVLFVIALCLCAVLCMISPYISLPLNKLSKWIEKRAS